MSSVAMTDASAAPRAMSGRGVGSVRAVRAWIYAMACLVVLMVAIGGATRLTGSGLSITEWKPVTGAVPPLSDGAWASEFEKYRSSSQYRNLNQGMTESEFRTIYWWEWSHRQLGRLIGLVFAVPLVGFWLAGSVTNRLALKLLGIGALGGLQATVGWIMVASGLEPGMTAVAPLKLMAHLVIASAILALLVWVAAGLSDRPEAAASGSSSQGGAMERSGPQMRPAASAAFLALVFVQVALGGLVAGSKAGLTYNTWPLMDGRLVPSWETLSVVRPWIENLVDNPALVQLNHRVVAYGVVLFALWQAWMWRSSAPDSSGARRSALIAALALLQAGLGVATLLLAVPLWAGLSHQLLAMGLLVAAARHARLSAFS